MEKIDKIIEVIDEFLERTHQDSTTPVEINPVLELKGLLNDSASRPGLPIRKLLRKGKIPHAYQVGVNWHIPHSKKSKNSSKRVTKFEPEPKKSSGVPLTKTVNKLVPIGNLIVKILAKKYNEIPKVNYEYKPDWLLSNPPLHLIESNKALNLLYIELNNKKFNLKGKYTELTERSLRQKQAFDIWIGEPFNFAVEFDEKQHFNQFRNVTLKYYDNVDINYPLELYEKLNKGVVIKPGKSGFTKLRSHDPLFPEIIEGERQDNRIRQRAFRDFLKDLLPITNGYKPTLRIPYQMANFKIKEFSNDDLKSVENYIYVNELI
jgi:hypothetical protein